jgi:hypothetical protein
MTCTACGGVGMRGRRVCGLCRGALKERCRCGHPELAHTHQMFGNQDACTDCGCSTFESMEDAS